jgi:hypothetical protein
VVPLRLGGLRGKKSTPSVWLGCTGELSLVGKPKRHGAKEAAQRGDISEAGVWLRYDFMGK